jgi:hypothetical protein
MKRNGWVHLVLGGALVLGVGTAVAQGPGGHHGPFGGPMELMGFEGMLGDLHVNYEADLAGRDDDHQSHGPRRCLPRQTRPLSQGSHFYRRGTASGNRWHA